MKSPFRLAILAAFAATLVGGWAQAQEVSFKDPTGDDHGPVPAGRIAAPG